MTFEMNKDVVVQVPKDTLLDGVIISVEKTKWNKIIDPDKLHKFEFPDEDIVQVKYEVKHEDKIMKGDETFRYYEFPMANSKLGKFLNKYETLKPEIKIKVDYNTKGIPSIRLE